MASPSDYRATAAGRVNAATGPTTIDNATGAPVAPLREASPEDDGAPATIDRMVSAPPGQSWFPSSWMKAIVANDDAILARDGSGLKLYDSLLSDETAMSTLQQRRLAITSKDWEVRPGDENDPRSVKAADDFRAMLNGIGFDGVTGHLHYAVWYGYAVGEGLFSIKEHDGRLIVWLDDIVVPDRRWFGFTNEGELRFVGENATVAGDELPPNKFLTIRTGASHDFAFYGMGLAHWCYWPIFFKRAAIKFWALYLEKLGQPTVAVEFTEAEKDDNVRKQQLLSAAVAVGKDSAVLLPEGTIKNERIKLLESTRSGSNVSGYKDFVTEQNEAIMRVVLGQPGTSGKGHKASLNSSQPVEDAEVKREIVSADSDLISEGLNRTFAKWLTRWNYGEDVAPPTVARILDEGESIDARATRDATLDAIGIKLDDEGINETYGPRYKREVPPPPPPVAIPGAGGNVVDMAAARRAKVAEFAAQGGTTPLSPLYVSRKLLNAAEVIAWAKGQGIAVTVPADDMHVTILYSKTAVDWFAMAGQGWDMPEVTVDKGGPRFVERFGDPSAADAAVVLRFASPVMTYRHDDMIERGASSDFPTYKPHVTLSYDAAGVDLAKVEPFTGELRFGPEIFEPIKADAAGDDFHAFTAADEDAIERLIDKLCEEADPVFEAMGEAIRASLQGVSSVEGARVAILGAMEKLPVDRLAKLTALPMLAERAGASVGADDLVTA